MGNVHGRTDSMNANAEALLLGSHLVIINTSLTFFSSLFSLAFLVNGFLL